ncbi:glycoside hydrolase family 19 protein [Vreelandella venusta]|uniref:glycoside hydrolase family 19 protein n=1 Tax=Vreelandella venusta TaxID=44935 RepID=UPI001171915B|nr:glycoside hydrolase family 19 protein [Halomonas venusta]GEK52363.1 chitinase [Halomonas venusta]
MANTHRWLDEVVLTSSPIISSNVLHRSMPNCKQVEDWAEVLNHHINKSGFDSDEEVALFLAQVGHESLDLNKLAENMNYKSQRLVSLFGRHRISVADAAKYGRSSGTKANQKMIANLLYGGEWGRRNLGNTQPNDGWDYRGSGPMHLTGRANFDRCGAALGLPILAQPELVRTDKDVATQTAIWYWETRVTGTTIKTTTKQINGGYNGIEDRSARFTRTIQALKENQ